MYDICTMHLCDRVKKYFQLDGFLTYGQIMQWCKNTYCQDNEYIALIHAIDTVIAGTEILNNSKTYPLLWT
jgi:hypothetical protein